jgi:HPt (histidine-containing phosphotransfer) domain-containing protein
LIGSDDDAVREFLGFYVKSEKPLFDELEQARAQGDLAAAASIAHRLRSSSITIGAATLGSCCAELERICRNGERAALDQAVLQSREELQRVLAAIDLLLRLGATAPAVGVRQPA